jgi:predicted dehydrogenase
MTTNGSRKGHRARAAQASRKVRYAVVGLGHISQVAVLPAFAHAAENSELVALVSSDEKKLRALAKRYRAPFTGAYDDMESVLTEANVDAVYLAVPNSLHREMTETIARLGIHVLCEKPMAMTSADCEAMIRATDERGVKLMIAYRLHFERANLTAIQRIQSGAIGDARLFSSVFCQQVRAGDIRTQGDLGGGALFDLGVYCVNAARYLFADEPEEVSAMQLVGTDPRFSGVDATTMAIMRFPGNRLAQFVCSQGAADVGEYRVVGSKGDVRLDPAYEYAGKLQDFVTLKGKTKKTVYPKSDQFAPELVYFSRCILDDKKPEPSGEEGLADVRIMEALVQSAKSGHAVKLAPFTRDDRPSLRQAIKKPPIRKPPTLRAPSPSH